jgi:hypothetical protein
MIIGWPLDFPIQKQIEYFFQALGESSGHLILMKNKHKQPFDYPFPKEGRIGKPHICFYYNGL